MRIFVAINPTAEVRARLAEAARGLREAGFPVRWVPPENVHLTLKFLGEVPEGRVPEICSAVDSAVAGAGPFEMAVSGFGAFPSLRRPRVVWAGIELSPPLERLQAELERALAAIGFPKEDRPYHPHLTLGRTQKYASASEFEGFAELVGRLEYDDAFHVRAVDVMRSRLMPSGALYDVVHSAGLES
jgi:2'-5' RNA ligase